MADPARLQQLLISLQRYLTKSGITVKSKWMSFSPHPEMSPAQFTRRLNQIGISITNKETLSLWRALKIDSKALTFDDFLRFLNTDVTSLTPDLPPPLITKPDFPPPQVRLLPLPPLPQPPPAFNLWSVLNSNRRAFLLKLSEFDPLTTGHISTSHFQSICEWLRPSPDTPIHDSISSIYDSRSKGSFNYFTLLSDICDFPNASLPKPRSRDPSGIDPDLLQQSTYVSSEEERPSRAPLFDRNTIRQLETAAPAPISRGGRGKLDPAIFGGRRCVESPPTIVRTPADAVIGAKPFTGFGKADLLREIPRLVFRCGKSNKDCYQRWRGVHELLTASDLRDGIARDAKVVLPLCDLEDLIGDYGGPMRLNAFVRMVSDGNRSDEKPTEDEAALIGIVRKIRGEKWSQILYSSSCVDDIVLGFQQEGIEVAADEIRLLTSKLGRMGLISAIHARLEQ